MEIVLRWATELEATEWEALAELLDGEYAGAFGPFDATRWYGYAPGELHALVYDGGELVAHAATARRFVSVGGTEVLVAGTGGVVTRAAARGRGLARAALGALGEAHRTVAPAEFGLLGCREEVVGFYRSCGYMRVDAEIRDLSPADARTVVVSRGPTLVCSGTRDAAQWPAGVIDLRGLPW